jgi:glycosyltransferase involved in cell wall biosynthesis
MKQALISIVLPTHNGSKYIEETIKSIIKQTYSKWELIIVDDCSTDETPLIIKRYVNNDESICSVRHLKNLKLPNALNTGFSYAKGDYLTWISDDNYYHPEALEKMSTFLDNNPQIDIVYADYQLIDEKGKYIETKRKPGPEKLLYGNCIGPCFLYRRIVQLIVGNYSEDFFLAEDYEYWLRCSHHFKFAHLDRILCYYRKHKESLSLRKEKRVWQMGDKALLKHIHKIKWACHQEKAQSFIHLTYRALKRSEFLNAIKLYGLALMHSPIFTIKYSIKRIDKFWSFNL